jgi:hypothetical protein
MSSDVMDPEAEPLEAIPVGDDPSPFAVAATWLGVALVAVVVVWFAWTQVINPSGGTVLEEYVDGNEGYVYDSLQDQFKAEFPERPTRRVLPGEFGDTAVVTNQPTDDATFTVIREPKPETALESYRSTLNRAADAIRRAYGGEVVTDGPALPLAIQSVAVKRLVLRKGDEYQRSQLVLAKDRLYTVQATTPDDDDEPFNRLFDSFEVLGER